MDMLESVKNASVSVGGRKKAHGFVLIKLHPLSTAQGADIWPKEGEA